MSNNRCEECAKKEVELLHDHLVIKTLKEEFETYLAYVRQMESVLELYQIALAAGVKAAKGEKENGWTTFEIKK